MGERASLTFAFEDVATSPSLPGHVLKAQQGGVNPQALAPLPYPVHIAWAYLGHQGHCRGGRRYE